MAERLPIIYSAHHAGFDFGEYSNRTNLTEKQKVRFSDYGTHITVPMNGVLTLRSEYSRSLGDLNRGLDHHELFPEKDYGKPNPNLIWKEGMEPTQDERGALISKVWLPYHERILSAIEGFDGPGFVIAWDNTAHYIIGKDSKGKPVEMKPFILSNRGQEGSTRPDPKTGESVTCDPEFLLEFGVQFQKALGKRGLPMEIHFNLVFPAGYVTQRYNTRTGHDLPTEHEVQSFQVEYDTKITHDQKTLEPNPKAMQDLREAFEEAIRSVL